MLTSYTLKKKNTKSKLAIPVSICSSIPLLIFFFSILVPAKQTKKKRETTRKGIRRGQYPQSGGVLHHFTHHWVLGQKTKQVTVLNQFQSRKKPGPKPIGKYKWHAKEMETIRIRPSLEAAVLPPKPHWIATQAHSTHTTCTCAVNSTTRLYKQNRKENKPQRMWDLC